MKKITLSIFACFLFNISFSQEIDITIAPIQTIPKIKTTNLYQNTGGLTGLKAGVHIGWWPGLSAFRPSIGLDYNINQGGVFKVKHEKSILWNQTMDTLTSDASCTYKYNSLELPFTLGLYNTDENFGIHIRIIPGYLTNATGKLSDYTVLKKNIDIERHFSKFFVNYAVGLNLVINELFYLNFDYELSGINLTGLDPKFGLVLDNNTSSWNSFSGKFRDQALVLRIGVRLDLTESDFW